MYGITDFWVGHLNVAYMTTFSPQSANGVPIEAPWEISLEMIFNVDKVHGGMPSDEESDLDRERGSWSEFSRLAIDQIISFLR